MNAAGELGAKVDRVPFVHPVRVRRQDSDSQVERLWAVDVSPGGMFVRTPRPLHVGTAVEVFAEVNEAPVPLARGEVAWRRTLGQAERENRLPGYGVRFTEIDPAGRGLIDDAVERLAKGVPIPLEAEALAPTVRSPSRAPRYHRSARPRWIRPTLLGFVALAVAAGIGLGLLMLERGSRAAVSYTRSLAPAPLQVAVEERLVEQAPVDPSLPGATPIEAEGLQTLAQPEHAALAVESSGAELAAEETLDQRSEIALPSGAVKTVRFSEHGDELAIDLELSGPFVVSRAFSLRNPTRLVLDVNGLAPKSPEILEGAHGVETIELLPREDRTRLRFLLDRPIERIQTEDRRVVAYFARTGGEAEPTAQ